MPDDWELDDWEDDAFDEDVWDSSQVDDQSAAVEDDAGLFDDGVAAGVAPLTDRTQGGDPMAWSAWDVGTVFALGGWLADHHADQTARQVAAAMAEHGTPAPDLQGPRGAAHPPPASSYHYGAAPGALTVGGACDPVVLFAELQAARSSARDLMFWLQGPGGSDGPLSLVISAVPRTGGPQLWVVAEEAAGGFATSQLIPVFEPEPHGGFALFATDHPHEAVDAAVWACQRAGVALEALTVTERRPATDESQPPGRPEPRLLRSVQDARIAARDWLRYWRLEDAAIADTTDDEAVAVTVTSSRVVAHVDAGLKPIDAAAVRTITALGLVHGKQAVVFALAGLTSNALQQATDNAVACFEFDLQGEPQALNAPAASLAAQTEPHGATTVLLGSGDAVDPPRLAGTLYDALVVRELAWVEGRLHTAWTTEPIVWTVTLEGDSEAYLSFYPLPLDRRWVRHPHPGLSSTWKRYSVIDYAQQELGGAFSLERGWKLVEAERNYEAITYGLTVDAGDIGSTLHHLVEELETTMRAFGSRLETTTLQLGQTQLEVMKAVAEALERGHPQT